MLLNNIILKKFEDEDLAVLGQYTLPNEQMPFTMLPREWPNIDAEKRKTKHPVTIWFNQQPIGFFVLDEGEDKLVYTQNHNAVLLRSLSINPQYQGKGIGRAAMSQLLTNYIKQFFTNCNEIIFGVNEQNEQAYKVYINSGFADTGKKYAGGAISRGRQIIMSKKINDQ